MTVLEQIVERPEPRHDCMNSDQKKLTCLFLIKFKAKKKNLTKGSMIVYIFTGLYTML